MQIINDKNETIGVYCGSHAGQDLRIDGRYVVMIFHSDYSLQDRGFLIVLRFNAICK